jgi:hypothetical protein
MAVIQTTQEEIHKVELARVFIEQMDLVIQSYKTNHRTLGDTIKEIILNTETMKQIMGMDKEMLTKLIEQTLGVKEVKDAGI